MGDEISKLLTFEWDTIQNVVVKRIMMYYLNCVLTFNYFMK